MKNLIEIYFDGGCRPTNPGNKYGSWEVLLDNRPVFKANRVEFGWGTNNEAEFDAMIQALEWTVENLVNGGFDTRLYTVQMATDSMIVRNRMDGRKVKSIGDPGERMKRLADRAKQFLWQFSSYSIHWRGRRDNVKRFGH